MAAGQEVDHRSVRVRHIQRAGRRQVPQAARRRQGHRMSAHAVPDGRRGSCGKRSRQRRRAQCCFARAKRDPADVSRASVSSEASSRLRRLIVFIVFNKFIDRYSGRGAVRQVLLAIL